MFEDTRISYSVCIAVSVLITASCQREVNSPHSEDIGWEIYAERSEGPQLAAGKYVFVLVYPEINPESVLALDALGDTELKRLCKNDVYVALLLKYDDWSDPRLRYIVDTTGFTKKPFLVLFSPNGEAVAFDPFTLDRMSAASGGLLSRQE